MNFIPYDALFIAGAVLVALIVIGLIFSRLYRRASKEIAFVRTGFGGQKVIVNGGALVFPVLHETIPVNMNTLRLDVRRHNDQALITKDRMRVDVAAEFYVRAQPTEESIANAAQTLGLKTMEPEALKQLVEGKFVDALRSVAAEMGMEELHEQRTAFVQKVQQVVTEDLLKNGLELESVSLTGLDQTSREFFNPDNAFDAAGLTKLTEEIEALRRTRNDIEQDTEVQIRRKNLEAEQQKLEIGREEEYAKLAQEREIQTRKAHQESEIAMQRAEKRQAAEQADIAAQQHIDQTRIASERIVEEQRIDKERKIKELEIDKLQRIETADVQKIKSVELAEQDRAIAIAEKSKDQSLARKNADEALAEAVMAEEQVKTVRQSESAERQKLIELIEAAKEAERDKIDKTVSAQAEREAAEDRAKAILTLAEAAAQKERLAANAEADAEQARAEGAKRRYEVDAIGKRAINEAANALSVEQIAMQIKLAIVSALPQIIRESAKPMEQIDGIKIIQVDGLNGATGSAGNGGGSADRTGSGDQSGGLADQVVSSALRYRAQAPLVQSILKEVGLDGGDLNGLTEVLAELPNESGG